MNNKITNENNMTANKGVNLMRFGKFPSLLMREFYEHKTAFLTVPVVIAGIILLIFIAGMFNGLHGPIQINGESLTSISSIMDHINDEELGDLKRAISAAMMAVGLPILIILPFVVLFPLLNSLYEERIERSYLFWKSMPVSDLQEVLAKLTFIVVLGPMLMFAIASALSFTTMVLVSPYMWLHDLPLVGVMWSQTPFISGWVGVFANYLVWALWALPIFGWILLASSYAPKAPLLFVVVPPVVVTVLETISYNYSYLGNAIESRLGQKFGGVMERVMDMERFTNHRVNFEMPHVGDAVSALGASLSDPSFWMGIVVTTVFLTGAVYMRRYKI